MELWDLMDETRKPLGRTHRRGKPMGPGEYHLIVEVWTVGSDGRVLVTLRDPRKESYPNKWETTAGSAQAGETSLQAVVRELREETGIVAAPGELTLVGTCQEATAFFDVYLLRRDAAVEQLTMQEGETVAARWVTPGELDAMIADESFAKPTGLRLAQLRERLRRCLARA